MDDELQALARRAIAGGMVVEMRSAASLALMANMPAEALEMSRRGFDGAPGAIAAELREVEAKALALLAAQPGGGEGHR